MLRNLVIIVFTIVECTEVYWKPKTDVFQYSKDAILVCGGNRCNKDVQKLWMGGKPYNVLCANNRSSNPDKYEFRQQRNDSEFDLMIKNISANDLNCNYTCTCGFYHFTSTLKADKYFLYPPDVDQIKEPSKNYDDTYDISVHITKVYPEPYCTRSIIYGNNKYDDEVQIVREQESGGMLLSLQIKSIVDCNDYKSKINVSISCSLKRQNYTIFTAKLDCRQGDTANGINLVIATICSLLIVSSGIAAFIILRRYRMAGGRLSRGIPVQQEEN